jgi:signal transduction histidine kinase
MRAPLAWLDDRLAWTADEDSLGSALASREALARFLGALFVAGAIIGLGSLALPQPGDTNTTGLLAILLAALFTGVLILRAVRRVTPRVLQGALLLATAYVTFGIYYTDHPDSFYAFFYVWIALISFFFLDRGPALAQVALIGAAFGALMVVLDAPQGVARWLVTFGVVAIAGLLVGFLKQRVLRLFDRVAVLERHRVEEEHARDLNDNVIQGLTLAKYAIDAGQYERGQAALAAALEEARRMMSTLLRDAEIRAGDLRRRTPADLEVTGAPPDVGD